MGMLGQIEMPKLFLGTSIIGTNEGRLYNGAGPYYPTGKPFGLCPCHPEVLIIPRLPDSAIFRFYSLDRS